MSFTVNDFQDLLHIIEMQPEWRLRLKRALFPDIDLEKSFQELNTAIARLAVGQDEIRQDISGIKQDVSGLKQDVSVLKQDVSGLKQDVSVLKLDVSGLKQDMTIVKQDVKGLKSDMRDVKGRSQEDFYRQRIGSIFSRYLRKGEDATNEIADLLYEKMSEGVISDAEMRQVMAADLLWSAETRDTKRPVVIVLEASWRAEEKDIERAQARAAILQRAGLYAFAMVGGHEWTETLRTQAKQANVVTFSNGSLDDASWLSALAAQ